MGWKSGFNNWINIGKIAGEKGIQDKDAGKNGKDGENEYALGFCGIKHLIIFLVSLSFGIRKRVTITFGEFHYLL